MVLVCMHKCVRTLNAQATLLFHCTVCLAFSHRHIQCYFIRMRLFYEKTQRTHRHFVCALAHSIHVFRDCTGEQETAVCVSVYAFVDNNRSLTTSRFDSVEPKERKSITNCTQHNTIQTTTIQLYVAANAAGAVDVAAMLLSYFDFGCARKENIQHNNNNNSNVLWMNVCRVRALKRIPQLTLTHQRTTCVSCVLSTFHTSSSNTEQSRAGSERDNGVTSREPVDSAHVCGTFSLSVYKTFRLRFCVAFYSSASSSF